MADLRKMLNWLIYAGIGKLLIFLWMKFPLPQKIEKIKFIKSLHECGLCSGVYIFTLLALSMNMDILYSWFGFRHVAIIGEIITGCLTSYLVHIFSLGFMEQHMNKLVI